jgi:hypothetical protein
MSAKPVETAVELKSQAVQNSVRAQRLHYSGLSKAEGSIWNWKHDEGIETLKRVAVT